MNNYQTKLHVVRNSSFTFLFSREVKSSGMQLALLAFWILQFVSKISEQADLHQGWDLNIWQVLNKIKCNIVDKSEEQLPKDIILFTAFRLIFCQLSGDSWPSVGWLCAICQPDIVIITHLEGTLLH